MTLGEYLDTWLKTYIEPKKAKNTANSYKSALKHLSANIQMTEIGLLEAIRIQQEINELEAVFPRQAQILYTVLSAALKRAKKLHYIQENPMEAVDPVQHAPAKADYLRPEEARAYIQAAKSCPAGCLLVLMLCLGLRRNEARGLRCGDLDDEGILHISRQRTRNGEAPLKSAASVRDLPLPTVLLSYFQGSTEDWVCDVSEKSLRTQHRQVLRAIGCERRVTLHGLRHTCATMAILNNIPIAQVSKLLGHAHFSLTVDLYTHADLLMVRRCTNVISGFIFSHPMEQGARLEVV